MVDRPIHPMLPKASGSPWNSSPSAAAITVLLAALLLLATLLPSVGGVGVDSADQPLRPSAGFGL